MKEPGAMSRKIGTCYVYVVQTKLPDTKAIHT